MAPFSEMTDVEDQPRIFNDCQETQFESDVTAWQTAENELSINSVTTTKGT